MKTYLIKECSGNHVGNGMNGVKAVGLPGHFYLGRRAIIGEGQDLNKLKKGAKWVSEDLHYLVKSMNFISKAFSKHDEVDSHSHYNIDMIQTMIEDLKINLENAADELYINLGIWELMKEDNS